MPLIVIGITRNKCIWIARLQFWLKLHLIYAMTSASQIASNDLLGRTEANYEKTSLWAGPRFEPETTHI